MKQPVMEMATETENGFGLIEIADFLFSFCKEKEHDNGKDSYVYALNESRALLAVFDGSGDEGFAALKGKTGGYLASRAAAGACLRWFEDLEEGREPEPRELRARILRGLKVCREESGNQAGQLSTGAAAAICRPGRGGVDVQLQWAGKARVYLLDGEGLAQLTEDDPGGIDAMEALAGKGKTVNEISLDNAFSLHSARLTMGRPGLLFAATEGCFAGLSTPMEFEYLLLSTLQSAQSARDWEIKLAEGIEKSASGDGALSGIALNAGSFEDLKRQLARRTSLVYRTYIRGLESCTEEEKQQLWEHYRDHYQRLLCPAD